MDLVQNPYFPIEIIDYISMFASAKTFARMLTASKNLYTLFQSENVDLIYKYDKSINYIYVRAGEQSWIIYLGIDSCNSDKTYFLSTSYRKFLQLLPRKYSICCKVLKRRYCFRGKYFRDIYFGMKFTHCKWYRDYIKKRCAGICKCHEFCPHSPPHRTYLDYLILNDKKFTEELENDFKVYTIILH